MSNDWLFGAMCGVVLMWVINLVGRICTQVAEEYQQRARGKPRE
jgi:hypothetical protein